MSTDRQSDGGDGWGRTAVGLVVGCASLLAGLGCSQPVPDKMSSAGEFFRRIGPLSMVKMARAEQQSDEVDVSAGTEASDGAVPTIPDSKIRLDLGMRLEEARVDTSQVEIRVDGQVAVLEGTAASLTARDRIELLARSVEGVRAVDNRLDVRN